MILTKSTGYWATGITLAWREAYLSHAESWCGYLDYFDDGFCDDNPDTGAISTQGTLRTRYGVENTDTTSALTAVVNTLILDAASLGITWRGANDNPPMLYYRGDGEDPDYPPPDGYRELLRATAERIGWATYGYEPTAKAATR